MPEPWLVGYDFFDCALTWKEEHDSCDYVHVKTKEVSRRKIWKPLCLKHSSACKDFKLKSQTFQNKLLNRVGTEKAQQVVCKKKKNSCMHSCEFSSGIDGNALMSAKPWQTTSSPGKRWAGHLNSPTTRVCSSQQQVCCWQQWAWKELHSQNNLKIEGGKWKNKSSNGR